MVLPKYLPTDLQINRTFIDIRRSKVPPQGRSHSAGPVLSIRAITAEPLALAGGKAVLDAEPLALACGEAAVDAEPLALACGEAALNAEPLALACSGAALDAEPLALACGEAAVDADPLARTSWWAALDAEPLALPCDGAAVDAEPLALACDGAAFKKNPTKVLAQEILVSLEAAVEDAGRGKAKTMVQDDNRGFSLIIYIPEEHRSHLDPFLVDLARAELNRLVELTPHARLQGKAGQFMRHHFTGFSLTLVIPDEPCNDMEICWDSIFGGGCPRGRWCRWPHASFSKQRLYVGLRYI